MRKCIVHQVKGKDGSIGWMCAKYEMSRGSTFKTESTKCYHYKCPGRMEFLPTEAPPEEPKKLNPLADISTLECAWPSCNNTLKSQKMKFCSSACRSRSSSKTYREKQRAKKCSIPK